jgi:uncharacterized membrane protein YciS (DUF1049 family)
VAESRTEFATATGLLQNVELVWLLVGIYWLRVELSLVQLQCYSRMGICTGFCGYLVAE